MDYLVCIIPSVLVCTVLASYLNQIIVVSMVVAGLLFAIVQASIKTNRVKLNQLLDSFSTDDCRSLNRRILEITIKTYRMWCYLLTAISILAVDFQVFPRSQAKTENFGLSLMDTGVGLFVICHAMKINRKPATPPTEANEQSGGLFK